MKQLLLRVIAVIFLTCAAPASGNDCLVEKLAELATHAPASSQLPVRSKYVSRLDMCNRLGLPFDKVAINDFGKGGMNRVYELISRDRSNPVRFPDLPHIDPELRGKPIDGYLLKVANDKVDSTLELRDDATLKAIRKELASDPAYDGIRVSPTYALEATSELPRFIIQKTTRGKVLFEVLKPFLIKGVTPGQKIEKQMRKLFAHLIEAELQGNPLDQIFSAKNLTDLEGHPLMVSEQAIRELRSAWTKDPELYRIRMLIKRLYRLSRSRRVEWSNIDLNLEERSLVNQMPWSTGRHLLPPPAPFFNDLFGLPSSGEFVTGDFSHNNFFLSQDERGIWQLELFDF